MEPERRDDNNQGPDQPGDTDGNAGELVDLEPKMVTSKSLISRQTRVKARRPPSFRKPGTRTSRSLINRKILLVFSAFPSSTCLCSF